MPVGWPCRDGGTRRAEQHAALSSRLQLAAATRSCNSQLAAGPTTTPDAARLGSRQRHRRPRAMGQPAAVDGAEAPAGPRSQSPVGSRLTRPPASHPRIARRQGRPLAGCFGSTFAPPADGTTPPPPPSPRTAADPVAAACSAWSRALRDGPPVPQPPLPASRHLVSPLIRQRRGGGRQHAPQSRPPRVASCAQKHRPAAEFQRGTWRQEKRRRGHDPPECASLFACAHARASPRPTELHIAIPRGLRLTAPHMGNGCHGPRAEHPITTPSPPHRPPPSSQRPSALAAPICSPRTPSTARTASRCEAACEPRPGLCSARPSQTVARPVGRSAQGSARLARHGRAPSRPRRRRRRRGGPWRAAHGDCAAEPASRRHAGQSAPAPPALLGAEARLAPHLVALRIRLALLRPARLERRPALPLLLLLDHQPDWRPPASETRSAPAPCGCEGRGGSRTGKARGGGGARTRLVRFRVRLELGDKVVKLVLALLAALEAPLAQLRVVPRAQLLLARREPHGERRSAHADGQAPVAPTRKPCVLVPPPLARSLPILYSPIFVLPPRYLPDQHLGPQPPVKRLFRRHVC